MFFREGPVHPSPLSPTFQGQGKVPMGKARTEHPRVTPRVSGLSGSFDGPMNPQEPENGHIPPSRGVSPTSSASGAPPEGLRGPSSRSGPGARATAPSWPSPRPSRERKEKGEGPGGGSQTGQRVKRNVLFHGDLPESAKTPERQPERGGPASFLRPGGSRVLHGGPAKNRVYQMGSARSKIPR